MRPIGKVLSVMMVSIAAIDGISLVFFLPHASGAEGLGFGAVLGGISCLGGIKVVRMLKKLDSLAFQCAQKSDQRISSVLGSIDQVSNSSQDLADSSKEQLRNLQTTASASHEINSMISTTAAHTESMTEEARGLSELARKGREIVGGMVASSQEIKSGNENLKEQLSSTNHRLMELVDLIREVSNKTSAINDIVFQTKLLSFNASVEAARAGESGKGFAVVAEEVGRLATMSGKAAIEITQIIDTSVRSVQEVADAIRTNVETHIAKNGQKVENGLKTAMSCQTIFEEMVGKITSVSQMVASVSNASLEQAKGVSDLAQAISQMNEIAERNVLLSSQSSEHSSGLGNEVEALKREQEYFTLSFFGRGVSFDRQIEHFQWSPQIALNVPQMDSEHQILIDRINDFISAMTENDHSAMKSTFKDMEDYAAEHFFHEETFMQKIQYPQFASHKRIHENLLGKLAEYGRAVQGGSFDRKKVAAFLRNWLYSHIMGIDMKYAAHFNGEEKGRSNHKISAA